MNTAQRAVPAVWMRGGTSKGLFFRDQDLPVDAGAREALLLRALGSPDPYGTQIDGVGGATSSTSKVVTVAPSERSDCDVDYWFGHVAIDAPVIDASGNCGNLTAAVGPFAVDAGLVDADGDRAIVRIWQANIGKRIVAEVPVANGGAAVAGEFVMDGVAFPGAPVALTFEDAGGLQHGGVLPTGRVRDRLDVPGFGTVEVTLVHAGNPAAFVAAADLGLTATERPAQMTEAPESLALLNAVREHAAVAMGLAASSEAARRERPATPKIHWVGPPRDHALRTGRELAASDVDLCARALSMGRPHHAYPGTSAVATAVAAALPDSVVARQIAAAVESLRIGHAAGVLEVGAQVRRAGDIWTAPAVYLTRSARALMRGEVLVPGG